MECDGDIAFDTSKYLYEDILLGRAARLRLYRPPNRRRSPDLGYSIWFPSRFACSAARHKKKR